MMVTRTGPGQQDPRAIHYMVRMRDGIRLSTDVYLPDGGGPFPALLTRLPYDKTGVMTPIAQFAHYFTAHGYAVVTQDVRGKFRSEGVGLNWAGEEQDGFDTIDWIIQQDWASGAVGMWGNSYYGFTQIAAMSTQHPALRAISPRLTGSRLGEIEVTQSGASTRPVNWSHHYLYALEFFHSQDTYQAEIDWSVRPIGQIFEGIKGELGSVSPSFDQWYPSPRVRPRFRNSSGPYAGRAIPTLLTIGWWDNCAPYSWQDFEELQRMPRWKNLLFLEIDTIDHYSNRLNDPTRVLPLTEKGWAARIPRILDPTIRFFDVFLKNVAPMSSIPRVRWEHANLGAAVTSESWPPPGCEPLTLYAQDGNALTKEPADSLQLQSWIHDPHNLVPSTWDEPFTPLRDEPDETLDHAHPGTVSFETDVFDTPLDIVGKISATGSFASDGPQLDLFARLVEVDAQGVGRRIAAGNIHSDAPTYQGKIGLHYAGYRVREGSKLRLIISSSCYPEFIPLPGTSEDPLKATTYSINHQTLALGGTDGLKIEISVMPKIGENERSLKSQSRATRS